MSENCGQASTTIATRVRDPFFQAATQLQVINLLSYSQQVVNGVLSDVVQSAPLTLPPRTLIFGLSTFVPAAIKVLAITDASGRDLEPFPEIESLQWLDMHWPSAVADFPRGYCQVGADTLIVYPAIKASQTLTVKFSQYLAPLATVADATVVPAEDDSAVNSLTEALLLLKNRDLNALGKTVERFMKRIEELKQEKR